MHNIRLLGALAKLKVKAWPFAGAIAVVETDEVTGERAEHVFDRWCYLGSRQGDGGPLEGAPSFDLDSYKLLEAGCASRRRHGAARAVSQSQFFNSKAASRMAISASSQFWRFCSRISWM